MRHFRSIPKNLAGSKIRLFVTGIFGHMDFFVNGKRMTWTAEIQAKDGKAIREKVNHLDLGGAWSWNYNESVDLSVAEYLKFGEVNTFAFRTRDRYHWGGIFKRAQLYIALVDPPLPIQPAKRCDCSR